MIMEKIGVMFINLLVLLDHLIKYGNERVSQQCKENIFAIQTLKDFQYVEDQKDQGYNVREKAKQLVALLKDDERLRNERRKQGGKSKTSTSLYFLVLHSYFTRTFSYFAGTFSYFAGTFSYFGVQVEYSGA